MSEMGFKRRRGRRFGGRINFPTDKVTHCGNSGDPSETGKARVVWDVTLLRGAGADQVAF